MAPLPFLDVRRLLSGGPGRFNLAVQRLLLYLGFSDVRVIDGSGDSGGDILASRGNQLFVFQNKWSTAEKIGRDAVDEIETAISRYEADRAVVVTNAFPDGASIKRAEKLRDIGLQIDFWNRTHLHRLYDAIPVQVPSRLELRPYQRGAVEAVERDLAHRRRALLILATGLGKTVVGGEVISRHLGRRPEDNVLVLAHMKDLVQQLEIALWVHLPKNVPTQVLTGDSRPLDLNGVTCATIESALGAVYDGYRPAIVMIDESHHLSEDGSMSQLLGMLAASPQFGVTATPWRGDQFDITTHFGEPSFKMGIAEGMAQGYLAQVNYRVFVDDLDWEVVRRASEEGYSVKQLNTKLFLPQRDEAVAEKLLDTWNRTANPRCIVFCRTIEHAQRMADLLGGYCPAWRSATCLHSRHSKRDRQHLLLQFRLGRVPLLTAVDILNEGVDIPDVNIICFLRVTHSRRIFIQQLGRGLRLRDGKVSVNVLDFVTDIRRIAAVLDLRRGLEQSDGSIETLMLNQGASITFSNQNVGSLMEAWIRDAASLETANDEAHLQFPAI
jgi:superfamily II DNA or RNA helicase